MEGMALLGKWPEAEEIQLAFSALQKSCMNIYEKGRHVKHRTSYLSLYGLNMFLILLKSCLLTFMLTVERIHSS